MAAHGPHQTAGAAADFEGPRAAALLRFQAAELRFQVVDDTGRGRQKFRVALAAASEGDVVAGVDVRIWQLGIRHGCLLAAGVAVEFAQQRGGGFGRGHGAVDDFAILERLAVHVDVPV